MTYQVLARKWRPQMFDAVVGQDAITRTLRNALASGRVAHAYLFTGPRGVGKTTTARLLAKALACTGRGTEPEACGRCASCVDFASGAPVDVLEIDAASNNGVEEIRTLRENVKYAPARGRYKVYIVDEVHMLSGPAFNAFLKTLEEPPDHVVFILATTDPKKIPPTVLSRCQRFDFRPIPADLLTRGLTEILTQEKVEFDPAALPLLVRAAEGSLRDALSLLDAAIAYGEGRLEEASVAQLLGTSSPVQVRALASALLERDAAAALTAIDRAARQGEDLSGFTRDVVEMLRRLLVVKVAPASPPAELTPAEVAELEALAEAPSVDELVYCLRVLLEAQAELPRSPYPRVEVEMAAVRATRRPQPQAIEALISRVEEAERRLRAAGGGGVVPARPQSTQGSLLPGGGAPPAPAPPRPRFSGPEGERSSASAPSPAAPPVSAAPPAPATDLGGAWQRVVTAVLAKKALLGSVLQHATPIAVRDGALAVNLVASRFHQELLADRANRELVNQAVAEHVAGARRLEISAESAPAAGAAAHPAVQAARAAFDAEVVAVRPRIRQDVDTQEGEGQ
ncbi:MAG TPA: DNA polymerase III subunit gamma/tau [Methylomirabilota bacterium]|nr:DNA polymerase III subunit gamma/tau [Methylomirabilota bacterium]